MTISLHILHKISCFAIIFNDENIYCTFDKKLSPLIYIGFVVKDY